MTRDMSNPDYRHLPSIDRILQDPDVSRACEKLSRPMVLDAARETLADVRRRLSDGGHAPETVEIVRDILDKAEREQAGSLTAVINATGVVVHTNLGRAPLSREAIAAMKKVSEGYSNLEFDLASGERGSRHTHLEGLLRRVTGADASLVVNNNAAALLLTLMALAKGKEVVLSRGQSVEIGGGFRIPDVMRQSGAKLVEVGTTNRTHLADYEAAIGPRTAALMRVHSSNFRVVGFTAEVSIGELAALGRRHGVTVIDDLGSGALLDTAPYGLAHEPTAQESVAAGVDVVCFSGDKLLGGPQAGIIVGRREVVEKLPRHPLARAVRVDKATIAGLHATLLHYVKGEATEKVPVWRMIAETREALGARAEKWARALAERGLVATTVDERSTVGGGSLPGETLPTRALAIARPAGKSGGQWLVSMAGELRRGRPPVVGRIEKDRLLLDPRTVLPEQDETLLLALLAAVERAERPSVRGVGSKI